MTEAIATEALSMMRLMIISVTIVGDFDRIARDFGDFPGQLIFSRQIFGGLVRSDVMRFHDLNSLWTSS